jgi:pimeloyl-ACP methyl ester carboxylesterase
MQRLLASVLWIFFAISTASADEAFFDSDGIRIRYLDLGKADGPPVLLIHGYMASADLNWRIPGVVAAIEDTYRVILIDNRGHGRSDKPTDVADYGPKMADDQIRLLDHLSVKKAHVVGYSMGGMITLFLAAHHPERMLSAGVTGMGWLNKEVNEGSRAPSNKSPRPRLVLPKATSPALKACITAFPQLSISRDELVTLKVPMRVIIGSADPLYESRVKPLTEVRPDIPVVLIDGGNHLNCMFRGEFKQAVRDFLDAQPTPKAALTETK